MNNTQIILPLDILFYAFRYALSRQTSLYMDVIPMLEKYWKKFKAEERKQILHEISFANRLYDIDKEWILWMKVMETLK